jgi:hypothetical protein
LKHLPPEREQAALALDRKAGFDVYSLLAPHERNAVEQEADKSKKTPGEIMAMAVRAYLSSL